MSTTQFSLYPPNQEEMLNDPNRITYNVDFQPKIDCARQIIEKSIIDNKQLLDKKPCAKAISDLTRKLKETGLLVTECGPIMMPITRDTALRCQFEL